MSGSSTAHLFPLHRATLDRRAAAPSLRGQQGWVSGPARPFAPPERSGRDSAGLKRCCLIKPWRSAEFLREPYQKSFGPADVAEPIHVFVLDHLADELRAVPAEPAERLVDVIDGEHDA